MPPHGSNIVNSSIPIKPSLRVRFGWTMIKYVFMSPPPKVEVKGRSIYGHTNVQTNILTDEPNITDMHTFGNRYHTFNHIDIYSDKNPIRVLTVKVIF